MNWIRTPTGRNLLLLGGAFVAPLTFAALVRFAGLDVSRPFRLAIMLASCAVALWLVGVYWRGLDEAAREAQKSAGFWGGSFGTVIGLGLLVSPLDLISLAASDSPRALMMHGGMVVALCNVAGFMVAWAWWWWSRR